METAEKKLKKAKKNEKNSGKWVKRKVSYISVKIFFSFSLFELKKSLQLFVTELGVEINACSSEQKSGAIESWISIWEERIVE